ncbi:MAG TPA: SiaB family protein kinase [Xanthomonadaceae bacterium]|nr:SiaB family protein kinase [Xanthomonadaceae bacterium]
MDLFEIKERLREAGILISFSGSFSHSLIEELGTAVKKYLESSESKKPAMMDVFSVYIEAAQNVRNYSERQLAAGATKADLEANIIVIARRDEQYQIYAGNAVETADIPALTEKLERLNGLDKAALKALYKEQLRRERGPEELSAGLGLIEMARRASEPMQYSFTPIDGNSSYFSLCVVL